MPSPAATPPRFMAALPPYLGGKRRLCPLIFAELADIRPPTTWRSLTFHDPFAGGGAVSLTAKALGFLVVSSDVSIRGATVARALVENSSVRLTERDVLDLYREPSIAYPHRADAFVPTAFTTQQAKWLDRAVAVACARSEPVRSLLLLVIIKAALRLQPQSLLDATDAAAAGAGDYDRVSSRRLGHYLRADRALGLTAMLRIAADVNTGVFGGTGTAGQGDARARIAETACDVLFLDPPYPGTTGYVSPYRPLDALLRDVEQRGPPPTLDEILNAAASVPLVMLTYGGPRVSLDRLAAQVAAHRPVLRAIEIPYVHLRALSSKEHRNADREYLILAGR